MGTKIEQIKGTRGIANERTAYQVVANSFSKNIKYEKALKKIRIIASFTCNNSVCHKNCNICSDGKILKICKGVLND